MALVIVADDRKCPPSDQGEKCISFGCEVDPRAPITLGEWHLNLPKAKALADKKNIPMIAIWSNTGCSHCQGLLDALLTKKFIDWRTGKSWKNGTYSCPPMILVFMEGGKEGNEWTDENGKLHNQENGDDYNFVWGPDKKAGLYPFVAFYWRQRGTSKPKTLFTHGEDLTGTYGGDRGASNFIRRAEVFFEGYKGWDLEKDRPLDDFKPLYGVLLNDAQNLKTNELGSLSSIPMNNEGYGKYLISEPFRKKRSNQDLYLLSNLYSFSAFFYGSSVVEPETLNYDYFGEHLKLVEKNFRPLFIVYGNKYNQRMSNWSYIFSQNTRANPPSISTYQTVRGIGSGSSTTSAERDIYKGYYFLYFLDDEVGKPSKFQKVKDFINQYEDVIEKYAQPVYMIYCKYPDGHVYARYGSLNSFNRDGFKLTSYSENDFIAINGGSDNNPKAKNAIWNLTTEISKEINYRATKKSSITYVSSNPSALELAPQYAVVQAVERKWIPVKINLSSQSEVNQHIKDPAYAVSAFIDEATDKVYYPGQKIEVNDDITLKVVFDKPLICTVSFAARSSNETILLQSIVAKSENGSTAASCVLPAASEATSKCSKPGFVASAFEDQTSKTQYEFGQSISISRDITLCIVWQEQHGKDDQKPVKVQTKHVLSLKKSQFPISYTYTSLGYKFLRISNNISSVNFHGMIENRGLESQVTSAYIQPGIPQIDASCFYNCYNLTAINSDNSVKMIGDYAFYNCSSLKSINFLGTSNKELRVIGDHAFDGCGLESVKINHQGSVSDSSLDSWCFANCHQLTSVEFTNSTYLGAHMFDGCEKLREVKLNNYHSYVGDYAFANCKSLAKITFPPKMYMLSEHMFDGCINLTAIDFGESSDLRQIGSHAFANCPKLTSITFPASVNTLEYLDPECLAKSNVQRVVFKGVDDSQFVDVIEKTVDAKYDTGVMHVNKLDVVDNADDLGIPVFAYYTNINIITGIGDCGKCMEAHKKIFNTDKFKKWVSSKSYYFTVLPAGSSYNSLAQRIQKLCKYTFSTAYFPFGFYYWKNRDTGEVKYHVFNRFNNDPLGNTDAKLIATIDKAFSGWNGITTEVKVIKPSLTTFGQTSPVTFVSSTGNEYLCENNTITKLPTFRVDTRTDSDFKYGIWYYNAKQLKEFADKHHLPVLVEFGAKSCDPCQDFSRNTYRNQTFQEELKKRRCLLCKVEIKDGDSFAYPTTTQAYFVSHYWGESKTLIPQLVYYWKKSDNDTYKQVWNYNYRSDPANANYQTVLNKLDAMLGSYAGDSKYVAPEVKTSDDGTFRYYEIESQDNGSTSIELGKQVATATGQVSNAPDSGYAVVTISNVDPAKTYVIATCCSSSHSFCAYTSSGQFIEDGCICSQTPPSLVDYKLRVYELELQDKVGMLKITNACQAAASGRQAQPLAWHATSDIDGRYFICDSKTSAQKYTGSITVNLSRPVFGLDSSTRLAFGGASRDTSLTSVEVGQTVNLQDNWYQQYGGSTSSFADQKGAIFKVFSGIVESVFLFQNDEESFEISDPSDYKYPCGKWIQILDDTAETAFNEIVKQCQENSLLLVILESGIAQTEFDKNVKNSSVFQQWMRKQRYVFLDARSGSWSSKATKSLRDFEASTAFDGNTVSDPLPKMLVYHGCSTCTADGSIEIYCKKKIECSSSDPSYYASLIDQFSELT